MQNPKQKFRQSPIVFEKPGILSEKSKTLMSYNYHRVKYYLLNLSTKCPQKGVQDFLKFCLDLE